LAERVERLEAAFGSGAAGGGAGATGGSSYGPEAARTSAGAEVPTSREPSAGPPPTPAHEAAPQEDGETEGAPAEGLELEKLVGLWPAVIDQVRQGGAELLSHVLAAARPIAVSIEDAVLEVGFPPSAAFNKRKAEAAEARDQLADAIETVAGQSLRPHYVLLDGEEAETPEGGGLSEDELVELMRTEFDAEEYGAEPEDGEAEAKEASG
jgi:hypothetical protein